MRLTSTQVLDEKKYGCREHDRDPAISSKSNPALSSPVYRSCVDSLSSDEIKGRIRSVMFYGVAAVRSSLENDVFQRTQNRFLTDIEQFKRILRRCFLGLDQDWSIRENAYDAAQVTAQVKIADRTVT